MLVALVLGLLSPLLAIAFAAVMAFTQRHDRTLMYWLIGIVAFWVLWFTLFSGIGGGGFGGVVR